MTDTTHTHAAPGHETAHGHEAGHVNFTRSSYVIGFLLSVVLTAVPFWLVMTGTLGATATTAIIIACAIIQILVHTICFLHVNTRAEGGWTLMAYAFTAVMILIVIAGSLWIMYHLNANMMPAPSMEMSAPS